MSSKGSTLFLTVSESGTAEIAKVYARKWRISSTPERMVVYSCFVSKTSNIFSAIAVSNELCQNSRSGCELTCSFLDSNENTRAVVHNFFAQGPLVHFLSPLGAKQV